MNNHMHTLLTAFTTTTLVLVLLLGSVSRVNAQYAETKDTEEQQVRTLIEKFYKSFEETRDFKKVPKEFFIEGYREQLAQSRFWFDDADQKLFEQLSEKERYEWNTAGLNFIYLSLLLSYANNVDLSSDDQEEDDQLAAIFPPEILSQIINHRLLRMIMIGEGDETEIENIKEMRSLLPGIAAVNGDISRYLELNSSRGRLNEERKESESYESEACSGEICHGFPEKTTVHVFLSYPLVFEVYLVDGSFKIADFRFAGD